MKIYFISICGTGVGNLALLLSDQGHEVKGSEYSEAYFYPPISDLLRKAEIPVTMGFNPDDITQDLDLVIMGGAALIHDPKNPQVAKAKELGIRLISYAIGVGEFLSKENNIEVVGNHAKTTTTALVAWCLKECNVDPSYFIGGSAIGFDKTIYSGSANWSVCEGDEHPSLNQEPGGKFLYHKPKHVIFTSADWDHKNIYKSEKEYLQTYKDLFKIIPSDGLITCCLDGKNVLKVLDDDNKSTINLYSISLFKELNLERSLSSDDIKEDVLGELSKIKSKSLKNRLNFLYYIDEVDYNWRSNFTKFRVQKLDIKNQKTISLGNFETQLIGQIGIENTLSVIASLDGLGFDLNCIRTGVATFKGVHRKLELIVNSEYKVINDHAHSPIKIKSSIQSIRTKFRDNKIFVIFHISQSGLKERKTFNQLKDCFKLANFVMIPRVTPDMNSGDPIFGKEYKDIIKEGAKDAKILKQNNIYYTPVITQMKSILENNLSKNDVIVIMSSGDAREFVLLTKNLKINNPGGYNF